MSSHRFVTFVFSYSIGVAFPITTGPAAAQCELQETQKLTASNGAASDIFGNSVAISGKTLVVGASYRDCASGPDCGSAYVFRLIGGNWVQDAELVPSDPAPGNRFSSNGFSGGVAVDDDLIVVSAAFSDPGGINAAGAAYVFRFDGTAWVQAAKLTPPDAAAGDIFGHSIAVLNDRVFVGAPYKDDYVGALYVFRRQGTNWVQETKLAPGLCGSGFGLAVSAHGDRVLVGGQFPCNGNVASPTGAAYVFRREGTNWVQEAQLPNPPGIEQGFGMISVSLSDDVALIQGIHDHPLAGSESRASIFRRSGSIWSFEKLFALNGNTALLQVATNGDVAVVGGFIPETHVFIHDGNDWPEAAQLKPTDAPGGNAVAMSGSHVLLGAPGDDNAGGIDAGAAYVFDLPHDCNSNGVADECDIASGTSPDVDGNGIPDECCPFVQSPLAEENGIVKNRYISLLPQNIGYQTALRVTLTSLNHPDPPESIPPKDFSAFEFQTRWVGPPTERSGSMNNPKAFRTAPLQCEPYFTDWGNVGLLHIYGDAIVPGSRFEVQAVFEGCSLLSESNYSAPPFQASTTRWADVAQPFQQTCEVSGCSPCTNENCVSQPDVLDIAGIVSALKDVPGAPSKVEAQLHPNSADPLANLNVLDVAVAVDAVKRSGYPFPGPTSCPP